MENQFNSGFNFDHSYSKLSDKLFSFINSTEVSDPKIVIFNTKLAFEIGLNYDEMEADKWAEFLSGNRILEGSMPLAQAYAGHQFGHFTKLGDGRAILLGEHIDPNKKRIDIQLKGPGKTPYSRRGDGKATLKSMLREYLISEAVHGLGIPSSRSLAVVDSGDLVYREEINKGGILTRIASSHIRVGTFEYIRNFLSTDELSDFTNYVIQRHYPELENSTEKALDLLKSVMNKQIELIVNWMRVGFIHGVMNTDNMSIAGETFDYGPCAFMNEYDPNTVFSSIDTNGRYSFSNQAKIGQWNLSCLASSLLPIIDDNKEIAVSKAKEVLASYTDIYMQQYFEMMGRKLGFENIKNQKLVSDFINQILDWMLENKADYTNTFLILQSDLEKIPKVYELESFISLKTAWKNLLQLENISEEKAINLMQKTNPKFIPRNHLIEKALDEASKNNDLKLFNQLLTVLQNPYVSNEEFDYFLNLDSENNPSYQTYCGT